MKTVITWQGKGIRERKEKKSNFIRKRKKKKLALIPKKKKKLFLHLLSAIARRTTYKHSTAAKCNPRASKLFITSRNVSKMYVHICVRKAKKKKKREKRRKIFILFSTFRTHPLISSHLLLDEKKYIYIYKYIGEDGKEIRRYLTHSIAIWWWCCCCCYIFNRIYRILSSTWSSLLFLSCDSIYNTYIVHIRKK